MTVVVYRDGVMAADTAGWCGSVMTAEDQIKVRRSGDVLIGCSGLCPQIELFHEWFSLGANVNSKPFCNDEEGSFGALVVLADASLWRYDYQLRRYPAGGSWGVEGAHEEFCYALLIAGKSAVEVVGLAIKYCAWAGGRVLALEHK